MLASISCGALFAAMGLGNFSLSQLQIGAPAWTPPPVTPTPEGLVTGSQIGQEASGTATGLFAPGDVARNATNSRVNIRRTPGYLSTSGEDVLAQLQPGDQVTILDGFSIADNLNWRLIRFLAPDGTPVEGWVAEATASGVQILR